MTTPSPHISRRNMLAGGLTLATLGAVWGCRSGKPQDRTQPSIDSVAPPDRSTDRDSGVVVLNVAGTSLKPIVELREGSTAEISWIDLDTGAALGLGTSPTLQIEQVRRVGMRVMSTDSPAFEQVTTLNLGFDHEDDYGALSLSEDYDHDPQPVTGLVGLGRLTQLRRLCASRTPLTGILDLRGLSELEHVECYQAEVESIDLRGCSGLLRLCIEDCRLTRLDLDPVRTTLRDLRAAIQRTDSLTFAPLDGPMEALYHYCVRDQQVYNLLPHRDLPVVEEYWVWSTGQHTCDTPTSSALRSYLARDNPLDEASVDRVLNALQTLVSGKPGRIDLSGSSAQGKAAAPTSKGVAAASALSARGWRVSTN